MKYEILSVTGRLILEILILEQDVETDKHLVSKVDPLSEKLNVSTVPSLLQL